MNTIIDLSKERFQIMIRNGVRYFNWSFPDGTFIDQPISLAESNTGTIVAMAKDMRWIYGESFEKYVKGEGPKPGEYDYIPSEMEHLMKTSGATSFSMISTDTRVYQFEFDTHEKAKAFFDGPGQRTCYFAAIKDRRYYPVNPAIAVEDKTRGFTWDMVNLVLV